MICLLVLIICGYDVIMIILMLIQLNFSHALTLGYDLVFNQSAIGSLISMWSQYVRPLISAALRHIKVLDMVVHILIYFLFG